MRLEICYLFMLQSNGVIQHLNEVRGNLNTRHINDNRLRRLTRLRASSIIEGNHSKAIHDPVQNVAQSALGLIALYESDFDPFA